jgi:hypothetical protein
MPTPTDLGNSANWNYLTSASKSAIVISPGQIVPIPKFSIPILLDNPTIAIRVDSVSAKPTWRFAGDIFQEISVGILVGGQPDAIATRRRAWLNQICLFMLPLWATTYALTYLPPKWFRDVTISVWEYTGDTPIDNASENAAIVAQLTEIEQKINSLL